MANNEQRRRRVETAETRGKPDLDNGDHSMRNRNNQQSTSHNLPAGEDYGNNPPKSPLSFFKVAIILLIAAAVFLALRRPQYLDSIRNTLFRSGDSSRDEVKSSGSASAGVTLVDGVNLYTKDELAKFNGDNPNLPVFLAFLGKVYDVSKGRRHYGPGGSYHFFAGKDATRGFLTGDFQADLNDNLDGVGESLFGQVQSWEDTYAKSADYKQVGVLCGEFYQCIGDAEPGKPKEKLKYVREMIRKAKNAEAKEQEIYQEFPQCNSEWSQDKGGRVWCGPKSGGVERNWSGFPRLFLMKKADGSRSTRCACVPRDKLNDPRVELYPDCHPESETCKMKS